MRPATARSRVLLPDPFRPMIPMDSPSCATKETPRTAWISVTAPTCSVARPSRRLKPFSSGGRRAFLLPPNVRYRTWTSCTTTEGSVAAIAVLRSPEGQGPHDEENRRPDHGGEPEQGILLVLGEHQAAPAVAGVGRDAEEHTGDVPQQANGDGDQVEHVARGGDEARGEHAGAGAEREQEDDRRRQEQPVGPNGLAGERQHDQEHAESGKQREDLGERNGDRQRGAREADRADQVLVARHGLRPRGHRRCDEREDEDADRQEGDEVVDAARGLEEEPEDEEVRAGEHERVERRPELAEVVVLVAAVGVGQGQLGDEGASGPELAQVVAERRHQIDPREAEPVRERGGLGGARRRLAVRWPWCHRAMAFADVAHPRVSKKRRDCSASPSTSYSRWFCTRITRSAVATSAVRSSALGMMWPLALHRWTCGSWKLTSAPRSSRALARSTAGDSRWSAMFGL